MKQNIRKIREESNGITLIALIVTIIVLLILASISISLVTSNRGIISRAKFTEFASEYTSVNELKEMYTYQKEIEKANTDTFTIEDSIYPVSTAVDVADISESLKYCIVKNENISQEDLSNTQLVDLRLVDFTKINGNAKRSYAINVVNGNLYSIEGEEFDGRTYHTLSLGVNPVAQMTLPGNYELIIDAGEGKIVNWEVLRVFYDKYIPNTLSIKVYTSDDKSSWTEHQIQSQGIQDNKEEIEIIEADITRYLKVEVKIESVNGENSEISNIMVNYYGYRKAAVVPTVETTSSVAKVGNLYTVSTPSAGGVAAQGTGTVTQTITVPTESGNYVLNSQMIGSPSSTVKVTNTDGTTREYTINSPSDFTAITLSPGARVEITSTLSAGDSVGEVEILIEDKTEVSQKESKAKSSVGETWKTKEERTYMYDNGGAGFWERSSLNGTNIDRTGILSQGDNKRVKVTYQTSTDGSTWSNEFTNIQDAENIQYLRVRVQYQVIGDIEYGNTKSNILAVILNDGSYKARYLDEDGTVMFTDRVYFTSRDETAQFTMPNSTIEKTGKIFAGWIIGNQVIKSGETYTVTNDIDFTAKYRVKLDILSQGKASFAIEPNTGWQSSVKVTINNTLEDEDTTILQYKIGNDGTWKTYQGAFDLNKNTKVYGRFYNTFTEEIGYTFDCTIENIDGIDPEEANINLSQTTIDRTAMATATITATVTHIDNQTGVNTTKCKYIVNETNDSIPKDSQLWNSAVSFTQNPQAIDIKKLPASIWYLHVLTVDNMENKKETIKKITFDSCNLSITKDIQTGITISNNATTIGYNEPYSATITVGDGITLGKFRVKMGDQYVAVDRTNKTIQIPHVTGNLEIIATPRGSGDIIVDGILVNSNYGSSGLSFSATQNNNFVRFHISGGFCNPAGGFHWLINKGNNTFTKLHYKFCCPSAGEYQPSGGYLFVGNSATTNLDQCSGADSSYGYLRYCNYNTYSFGMLEGDIPLNNIPSSFYVGFQGLRENVFQDMGWRNIDVYELYLE